MTLKVLAPFASADAVAPRNFEHAEIEALGRAFQAAAQRLSSVVVDDPTLVPFVVVADNEGELCA